MALTKCLRMVASRKCCSAVPYERWRQVLRIGGYVLLWQRAHPAVKCGIECRVIKRITNPEEVAGKLYFFPPQGGF